MTKDLPYAGRRPEDLAPDELAELLQFHDAAYFEDGRPVISDAQYDALVALLRARAPDHPQLQRVGAAPAVAQAGDKVVHERPMLSLDKCTTADEFHKWLESIWFEISGEVPVSTRHGDPARREAKIRERSEQKRRFEDWAQSADAAELVALPKVDGLACSIRYDAKGRIAVAATRGDGRNGEDVTATVRRVSGLPQEIAYRAFLEVRGEVYMPLEAFAGLSQRFSNPRNLAAGILKAKEHTDVVPEMLRFAAYDIVGEGFETESDKLLQLEALGFEVAMHSACRALEAAETFDEMSDEAVEWPYEADGVVFRLNSCRWAKYLGETAHHPKGAIAWKFMVGKGISTLAAVEWSVGRTGVITPLAIVEAVKLSGALVSRATLHNVSRFLKMRLGQGDQLELVRRGGVIPHVERVVSRSDASRYEVPTQCPACSGAADQEGTSKKETEASVVLVCSQKAECPGVRARAVLHYCRTLEMDGFGEGVLLALSKAGRLHGPSDLYELTAEFLTSLPGFAELGASNLLAQVEASKHVTLAKFLTALGIPRLGAQTASVLAKGRSLAQLRKMGLDDFCPLAQPSRVARKSIVRGVGYVTAQKLVNGFEESGDEIDRLLRYITIEPSTQETVGGPLSGAVVVFTGALAVMKRADAQKWVVERGGLAGSDITAETTLLVVGGDELEAAVPSSKLKKALKLRDQGRPIEILSEAEFFARYGAT